jgi:glycosyltransferase involved in cell wall biosynthesis
MRIAVNTRLLLSGKLEGIGWFSFETLKRITLANPGHEFLFLFDRPFSAEFIFSRNITPIVLSPQARHPFLWHAWFEYSLPGILKKTRAELFLSPDGFLSLSTGISSLPVIHDINFIHRPDFHPWLTGKYYNRYFPRFARTAKRIATVSEYSKNDISRSFGISPDRIDVVYNGAGLIYKPLHEPEKAAVKNDLTGGKDYFLYSGSLNRRKNICRLLEAYDLFRNQTGYETKLVLAGSMMHKYPGIDRTHSAMTFGKDVIFTGHLEPSRLRMIYGAALALVYIPFFEGFGIPVLEAMNCDIPVITSNCTSLPEIAGNAALLVDPDDTGSVVDALNRVASDTELRKSLVERARVRRTAFSWDQTAGLLWQSMLKAIN